MHTVKNLKTWTSKTITVDALQVEQFGFEVMRLKDDDRMANSVDPYQTARSSSLIRVCTVCSDLSVPDFKFSRYIYFTHLLTLVISRCLNTNFEFLTC